MTENTTTEATATATEATAIEQFAAEAIAARTGKKGYANKFFAELMPKFNELLELHASYKAIAGGVDAAKTALIEGLTEESNPEMFEVYNSLAEAEELVRQLQATLDAWADSTVAESTDSPEEIKESFNTIKLEVDKVVSGAEDYFTRNEDVIESEDGTLVADSEDGAAFLKLKNGLPSMRRGKGTKPANTRGKQVREWVKSNGITGPEGQELGKIGVIPQWAFDAFDAAAK